MRRVHHESMNPSDDSENHNSRRAFLQASGGWLGSAWIVAQWPAIAAAAHHAERMPAEAAAAHLQFLNATDAADVDAICAQIVPSGATPGAREARAVYFIDRSLATYFSEMAPDIAKGLGELQAKFRAANPALTSFAAAPSETQTAFLRTIDRTPFFDMMRMLTVLGMFTSPKYGGNYQGSGWKLLGFVDQHAFAPPFGYYDAEYRGFVPYPEKHA
jgi:gluconate 2-dehydrogenase gamma chain